LIKYLIFFIIVIFSGCASNSANSKLIDNNLPKLKYTNNKLNVTIVSNKNNINIDSLINVLSIPVSGKQIIEWNKIEFGTGLKNGIIQFLNNHSDRFTNSYNLDSVTTSDFLTSYHFSADTGKINATLISLLYKPIPENTVEPLFQINNKIPDFLSIKVKPILLPDKNVAVPHKISRLPNAPRAYRNGIHRGIDFFSNWGTPIRAVADGEIIRSDLYFKEITPEFREIILKKTETLGRTPSDIFNSILLGRTVFIDHGHSLSADYRTITIYAHLSSIKEHIIPGYNIKAGEYFANSGNSGTKESTLGNREGSHLHWELIFQDSDGEYYFGQKQPYELLYPLLNGLFIK